MHPHLLRTAQWWDELVKWFNRDELCNAGLAYAMQALLVYS